MAGMGVNIVDSIEILLDLGISGHACGPNKCRKISRLVVGSKDEFNCLITLKHKTLEVVNLLLPSQILSNCAPDKTVDRTLFLLQRFGNCIFKLYGIFALKQHI